MPPTSPSSQPSPNPAPAGPELAARSVRKFTLSKNLLLLAMALVAVAVPVLTGEAQVVRKGTAEGTRLILTPAAAQTAIEKEQPMAKDASPGFLVATIKPSSATDTNGGFPTKGHHISSYNVTVDNLLSVAYAIHVKQIVNAPEWLSRDHYDVDGIPDVPGVPSLLQMREMYQKLLADRFHMVFHRETRDLPIYAITVAKGGQILKLADPGETLNTGSSGSGGQRILKFRSMPMSAFALNMNFYVDRPVIDQTSLPANYDFTLKWTYDDSRLADPDAAPSLFTAIKEQLGLEMKAIKGPAEVIVIDHIEKPSEN
jgi:uncharacterized protein (TIGR03435 family)